MLKDENKWFEKFRQSKQCDALKKRPIAYFCAEYALSDDLPIFAGGLGILAGDYIREAADQGVPLIGVGLYYIEGFEHKELSAQGKIVRTNVGINPELAGLKPAVSETGEVVTITVPVLDHNIVVRAWMWKRAEVTVYLLDTRSEDNAEPDRHITDKLYVIDKETRLKQEMILGIGGLRMLEALGYHPSAYHLNEGHSAFLAYEFIYHEMKERKIGFDEAKKIAKNHILFTNHTLLPAGNDIFSNDLVSLVLNNYAKEIEIPIKTLVDLGLVQQSSTFSMTILALRTAGKINAVSKLHAQKAKEIWTGHEMFPITNGIHLESWDKLEELKLVDSHKKQKQLLLKRIEEVTGEIWDEKTILLGWARRMVHYKRPLALVERLKRFGELSHNAARPIKLVFAGMAHPADEDGIELLSELQYRLQSDLKGVAVFLPNYNRELSELMVAGCDVWINTPVVGFEACGTSGMKAALNGDLPLTTKDGWIDEVNMYQIGWLLADTDIANEILDKLEKEILPMYYEKNESGVVKGWEVMMQNARELIQNEFSMTRTLRQYLEEGLGIVI
ncbi:MAG: alpha-glucan family phosphorylase [bacterium]